MTSPRDYLLTPEQTNPFAGLWQGAAEAPSQYEAMKKAIYENMVNKEKARYAPEMEKQAAQKAIFENMLLKPKAERAEEFTVADLAKQILANKHQSLENKWYEPNMKSTISGRDVETEKNKYILQHPGLMGGETTKEIEALKAMGIIPANFTGNQTQNAPSNNASVENTNPSNQPVQNNMTPISAPPITDNQSSQSQPFKTGNPLVDALLNRKFVNTAYQQKMTQGYNWAHLPVETKNQIIAQGYGMGIDPIKMQNYINQGLDISQIAQKEGLDPENLPSPIYAPTTATKTRVQQVEQVGRELDYLSSATTGLLKPYADTFMNISPEALKDQLSGSVEDQKRYGRYIAGLSLQTGLANGRNLMEGGKPGVQVMRMVKDSALKGIDQHSPIKLTKIAFEEAQKTIDQVLQKGAKIRTTTGMNPLSEIGKAHNAKDNDPLGIR